jgi:hypothetical protein
MRSKLVTATFLIAAIGLNGSPSVEFFKSWTHQLTERTPIKAESSSAAKAMLNGEVVIVGSANTRRQ